MRRLLSPFAIGLLASCFRPPDPDVLFSCDPADAPTCPEGYSCEDDGCCHRNGSDVEESLGACRLAPGTDGTTFVTATTGTGTDSTTGTDTGATTDTGPATTSEGPATTETTTETTSAAETTTTDTSSSTDAGSSSSSG